MPLFDFVSFRIWVYNNKTWIHLTTFVVIVIFQYRRFFLDCSVSLGLLLHVWMFKTYNSPPMIELKYFGQESQIVDNGYDIKPFKIDIPESDLNYLKEKLSKTREFHPPVMGSGFYYGSNSEYLKTFLEFWKTEYNWTERESYLNIFPQFSTRISGLKIHFIHVKPNQTLAKGKEILPLLLIHGWPGSVRAFYSLIPLLTTPMDTHDYVFEVIAPSTPGSGFSDAPKMSGLDAAQISMIFHQLMSRLGFEKYYIHASDTGALIGQSQAILHPDWILGYHSNVCIAMTWRSLVYLYLAIRVRSVFVDESKYYAFGENLLHLGEEYGFFQFSTSKPDSLGLLMSDSPAALAAHVLDKVSSWSRAKRRRQYDGGLAAFDKYDLLDIITIHWLTNSVATSLRVWKETFKHDSEFISEAVMMRKVLVPSGCVWFAHEIAYTPVWVLEQAFSKLLSLNYLEEGGHFPALEKPLRLSDDIWSFVKIARLVAEDEKRKQKLKSEL